MLRLIYGDKRNPTRTLDLSGSNIAMLSEGFNPGPGQADIIWGGQYPGSLGQRRVLTSRDNTRLRLVYKLIDSSAAAVGQLQNQIMRFALEARMYEEDYQGDMVWLEYRFTDSTLDSLPAPVWGQFSHYLRVLHIEIPEWPKTLQQPTLWNGAIVGVAAEFVALPYSEGLRQQVGMATGGITITELGVEVRGADQMNQVLNPSFGHPTWDNGWTAGANLRARQETRPGFTRSYNSAALLSNNSTSSGQLYTVSLDLTSPSVWTASVFVRRLDGLPVTTSDIKMYLENAVTTPIIMRFAGGPWYRAYAAVSAISGTGVANQGVQVQPGAAVIIDDFMIHNAGSFNADPLSFFNGDHLGCHWTSTHHDSISKRAEGLIRYPLSNELATTFTISGWITRAGWYPHDGSSSQNYLFHYRSAAQEIRFQQRGDQISYGKGNLPASMTDYAVSPFNPYTPVHFVLRQSESAFSIFHNGSQLVSSTTIPASIEEGGTIYLGSGPSVGGVDAAFDGWRIWDISLSTAQIKQLYDSEKPIKDRYQPVGMPPFFWTYDGGGNLANENNIPAPANNYNWGVVGGVSGDIEAETEFQFSSISTLDSTVDVFWLSRKAIEHDEFLSPADTFWIEFGGTAGSFGSVSGSSVNFGGTITDGVKYLKGRILYLARMEKEAVGGSELVTATPQYYFDSDLGGGGGATADPISGDGVSIELQNNSDRLYELGEVPVNWVFDTPNQIYANLNIVTDGSVFATRIDFLALLPSPSCRVATTGNLTTKTGNLIIIGTKARLLSSANKYQKPFEHRGDVVNIVPGKLNYLWIMRSAEGGVYNRSLTHTLLIYITPRFLLPGGPFA